MSGVLRMEHPESGIAVLTLRRPDRLNALDGELVTALLGAVDDLDHRWPETKVVVLRGEGRAFCAGVDLTWLHGGVLQEPAAHGRFHDDLGALMDRLESARQVTVAAVHGYAVAGGFELMLACDMVIAATDAQLGDEHIRRNFLPSGGSSQRLPRKVGLSRALYLLLTGHRMSGEEAVRYGLACAAVEPGELHAAALELARGMAQRDGLALHTMKSLVRRGMELPLADGLWLELYQQQRYRERSPSLEQGVVDFATGRDAGPALPS